MHTQVLFEHPLNEKMRTWLRIEFLIQQLSVNLPIADHAGALHFSAISEIYWMYLNAAKSVPNSSKNWSDSSENSRPGSKFPASIKAESTLCASS